MKIEGDSAKEIKKVETKNRISKANGSIEIDFGLVNLEANSKYVVFEVASSVNEIVASETDDTKAIKHVIKHENKEDKAQTIVVNKLKTYPDGKTANLQTTVNVKKDNETIVGAKENAAILNSKNDNLTVEVKDIISYEGLIPQEEYTFSGRLMKIDNSKAEEIKAVSKKVVVNKESDVIEINFGELTLNADSKYVVYEVATSTNKIVASENDNTKAINHIIRHEDPNDKAQTIVVNKLKTYPNIDNAKLITSISVSNDEFNAKGTSDNEAIIISDKESIKLNIKDTIKYENLVRDEEYTFSGSLVRIDNNREDIIKTASKIVTITNPNDTIELDFGNIDLLVNAKYVIYETATSTNKIIASKEDDTTPIKQIVEHKDKNDKAQTVIIKSKEYPKGDSASLKTYIRINDEINADDHNKASITTKTNTTLVNVKDRVIYEGLIPNNEYTFTASLMQIDNHNKAKLIKTINHKEIITKPNGEILIELGDIELEVNQKYVIFEVATSTNKIVASENDNTKAINHIIRHEDPNDKAQTVVVNDAKRYPIVNDALLRTTINVSAEDFRVSGTKESEAVVITDSDDILVNISDTINYQGLLKGETYRFTGSLVKIDDDQEEVIATSESIVVIQKENDSIEIDFGKQLLNANAKYVIYETATSIDKIIASEEDDTIATHHIIEHKDKNDKAQTIIIKEKEVEYPIVNNVVLKPI